MKGLNIIIMAAGNSTRLKSRLTKVMQPLCGLPLIDHILRTARSLKPRRISIVVGNDKETLLAHLQGQKDLVFAPQRERRGTAHAARIGLQALGRVTGPVLVLSGDVPLLKAETLKRLLRIGAARPLSLITAVVAEPFGYGRLLRDGAGRAYGIVEEKNASAEEKQVNEINAGVYCVEADFFRRALAKVRPDPLKKEYYLTDIVGIAVAEGIPVHTVPAEDSREILGVNTRAELAYLQQLRRGELIARHLDNGVGMEDPDTVYVDEGVQVGEDTFLAPGVHLKGKTKVGKSCRLEPGCVLLDAELGDEVEVKAYSHLQACRVRSKAVLGPFARLRPGTTVDEEAHVGNFVELKKTKLGRGSKANHLSYLGDAVIGKRVNVGAGTITCNYDGKNKFQTRLEDGVFVGSGTQLVAPVKVGKGAYIGAGTTVTKNVPPGALAVSRVEQKNLKRRKKAK